MCKELNIPIEECELSMGMSGDFELAVSFHESWPYYRIDITSRSAYVWLEIVITISCTGLSTVALNFQLLLPTDRDGKHERQNWIHYLWSARVPKKVKSSIRSTSMQFL